jgi:hypothetical protein
MREQASSSSGVSRPAIDGIIGVTEMQQRIGGQRMTKDRGENKRDTNDRLYK